jgi:hypothetical protein
MKMFDTPILNQMKNDFDKLLNSPIAADYTLNYNSATPTTIRALLPALKDDTRIIRAGLSSGIKRGDYLSDSQYTYLIIDVVYDKFPHRVKSIIKICDNVCTFQRWQDEVLDDYGNVITPAGYIDVAANVRCFIDSQGGYQFNSTSGGVGIVPNNQIVIGMQYNNDTRNIAIGDVFSFLDKYRVTNIDHSRLIVGGNDGLLIMYAEKYNG